MKSRTQFSISLTVVFTLFIWDIGRSRSSAMNEEVFPKCLQENTTEKSCCPCFQEMISDCNQTCPSGFLTVKQVAGSVTCESSTSDATTTTTTATVLTTSNVTMETENTTMVSENTTYVMICLKSCPASQFYSNETMQCLNCDDSCLKCTGTSVADCQVCKYEFNNTCYAACPPDKVVSKNATVDGSKLCEAGTKEEKDSNKLYVIIGAVAGVVVIIIVAIVIVCCFCRHYRNSRGNEGLNTERKAMSVIIEEKRNAGTSKPTAKRRADYENTSHQLPTSEQIEQQNDKVLRYTRDPTLPRNISAENVEMKEEEQTVYGNSAMIRLASNLDITNKKEEDVEELLVVEELGEAPQAPVPSSQKTQVPSKAKKPKGIVKSLSQRVSKRLGLKKGKPVTVKAEPPLEDYVDMSGEASLKDYENFTFDKIPQGRKADAKKTSPEDDLDVYENATPVQSNTAKGGKSRAKKRDKLPANTTKGGNSDTKMGNDAELEDYENMKELKELKKKPGKQKQTKKTEDDDGDDMEDYVNVKDELYENTMFQKQQ